MVFAALFYLATVRSLAAGVPRVGERRIIRLCSLAAPAAGAAIYQVLRVNHIGYGFDIDQQRYMYFMLFSVFVFSGFIATLIFGRDARSPPAVTA